MKKIRWNKLKVKLKDYAFMYHLDAFMTLLFNEDNVLEIYLFGSLINNTYTYDSDADIVLKLKKSRGFKTEQDYFKSIATFKEKLDVFPYSVEEFNTYINKENHFLQSTKNNLVKVLL